MAHGDAAGSHLASWAGRCPGNHESAGKRTSGRSRKGTPWRRDTLLETAWAAARTKGTYLHARFHRLAVRRGRKRAAVAVAHALLVIISHRLTRHEPYRDLGPDYFDRRKKDVLARRMLKRLASLGSTVTLDGAAA